MIDLNNPDVLHVFITSGTLRRMANHYVQNEWKYSRNTDVKDIVLKDDDQLSRRIDNIKYELEDTLSLAKKAPKFILKNEPIDRLYGMLYANKETNSLKKRLGIVKNIAQAHAKRMIKKEYHQPDGEIKEAGLIALNEEIAEYVTIMQPATANIICDYMESHPSDPAALKMALHFDKMLGINSNKFNDEKHGYNINLDNSSAWEVNENTYTVATINNIEYVIFIKVYDFEKDGHLSRFVDLSYPYHHTASNYPNGVGHMSVMVDDDCNTNLKIIDYLEKVLSKKVNEN